VADERGLAARRRCRRRPRTTWSGWPAATPAGVTALEAAAESAQSTGADVIDLATLEATVDKAAVRYDRDGDSTTT